MNLKTLAKRIDKLNTSASQNIRYSDDPWSFSVQAGMAKVYFDSHLIAFIDEGEEIPRKKELLEIAKEYVENLYKMLTGKFPTEEWRSDNLEWRIQHTFETPEE